MEGSIMANRQLIELEEITAPDIGTFVPVQKAGENLKKIKFQSMAQSISPYVPTVNSVSFVIASAAAGFTKAHCDYLCTGTADQTQINAAINALPSGGGKIVLREGTYNISGRILVSKANVTLEGMGNSTILKRMYNDGSGGGLIQITTSNNTVQNLQINGNKQVHNSGGNYGIHITGGSNNTITHILCQYNANNGIHLSNSDHHNRIISNTFSYNYYGINLYNSSHNSIVDNTCNHNENGGIYFPGGSHQNTISNNVCDNNSFKGMDVVSSNENIFSENICRNNSEYGIYSQQTSGLIFIGNTCTSNGTGIGIGETFYTLVSGNYCYGNANRGIYFRFIGMGDTGDCSITGNVCISNGSEMELDRVVRSIVSGNMCHKSTGAYSSSQYTLRMNSYCSNNLITGNHLWGKNYVDSGTGNTFANNKYN